MEEVLRDLLSGGLSCVVDFSSVVLEVGVHLTVWCLLLVVPDVCVLNLVKVLMVSVFWSLRSSQCRSFSRSSFYRMLMLFVRFGPPGP